MAYPVLSSLRMNVSLYQAAAGMNAKARWQEVIAENLAAQPLWHDDTSRAMFADKRTSRVGDLITRRFCCARSSRRLKSP